MRVSAPLCHFDEGLRVEEGNVVKQTIPQKQKEREHQVFVKREITYVSLCVGQFGVSKRRFGGCLMLGIVFLLVLLFFILCLGLLQPD